PEAEPRSRAGYAGIARGKVGVRDVIEEPRDTDHRRYLVAELDTLAEQHCRPQQLAAERRHGSCPAREPIVDGAAEAAVGVDRAAAKQARQQGDPPGQPEIAVAGIARG